MTKYGYARCSTREERQDISRQTRELIAQGAEKVFSEYISGASDNKPQLTALLATATEGDTIAVTEVSRLSRSLHELCHILEIAQNKRVQLECGALRLNYAESSPDAMAVAMLHIMGAFAELERGVTTERIRSGMAHARAKGSTMGRPRKTAADIPKLVKKLLPDYCAGSITATEFARRANISRPTLYKYLKILLN